MLLNELMDGRIQEGGVLSARTVGSIRLSLVTQTAKRSSWFVRPAVEERAWTDGLAGAPLLLVYLQVLDLLTTLVGFKVGAAEGSPFIRTLMHAGPAFGVIASKSIALALGAFCVLTSRRRLVFWINYWSAALVLWNLIVILTVLGSR